jgi:hypothetical protein
MGSILGKLTLLTLIEPALPHVQADYEYCITGHSRARVDQEFM